MSSGETQSTTMPPGGTLIWRARLTWLALLCERLAPRLLPLMMLLSAFVALAWLGLFELLEAPWRLALGVVTLAALAWFLWPLRGLRLPTRTEVARRLDASRPEAHRPLHTLADANAAPDDPIAAALWREHQRRAEAASRALEATPGDARLRQRDPFALRVGVFLALIAGAFVAGEHRQDRLLFALDWSSARAPLTPPRLDAWLDPPAYTGRPPVFLTQDGLLPEGPISVPVGATLSVRAAGGREGKPVPLALEHGAGLVAAPATSGAPETEARVDKIPPGVTLEKRILKADSELVVRRDRREIARFRLRAIPDLAPEVVLREAQSQSASPDRQTPAGLRLTYELKDDYGIAKADVVMDAGAKRTLYPAPVANLPLRLGAGDLMVPTEDHPWAGASVSVHLSAEDDTGQKARSGSRTLTLPARPFTKPLARALIEQRRALVFSPDERAGVLLALDALLFAPEKFTPNAGDYIALTALKAGLRKARHDDHLKRVAEAMFDYARYLEDGELSEAEKRLRDAEARLREAIERGAPQEEINRLAQDMRRAMDNYLRDLARRAEQEPNAQNERRDPNAKTLTSRDLADMLRKIEEATKRGDTAEAQRLLNELRDLLSQLRSARRQNSDPATRELGEQMRDLEQLQREQRDLKDRTFREDRDNRRDGQPPRAGQRQRGEQGGRQGNERSDQKGQGGEGSLEDQQQALRERLRKLRERMKGENGEGLEDADEGMGDAKSQLGKGNPGNATEGQQKALEGMGRAAEGLGREMERQMGQGEGGGEGQDGMGDQPGPSHRGRAESRTDPLGRPQARDNRNTDEHSGVDVPDKDALQGSIAERAERVLRELRRRLGEFERPRDELDYLERLLRRQQ